MKITCYATGTRREKTLVDSLVRGFKRHGEHVEVTSTRQSTEVDPTNHLVVFVGVRRKSLRIFENARAKGVQTLMLDKGYFNRSRYHRFSLNSPQPTYLPRMECDSKRLRMFKRSMSQHVRGDAILYIESTQKYYDFHKLGPVHEYSNKVCADIKRVMASRSDHGLRLVHRPRSSPSSTVVPTDTADVIAHGMSFAELLPTAYCVVTHGSNAGVEAFASGVPVVSLGSPEVNPVHDLVNAGVEALFSLKVPSVDDVWKRLSQLAWCQFSHPEVSDGFAWECVKPWMR